LRGPGRSVAAAFFACASVLLALYAQIYALRFDRQLFRDGSARLFRIIENAECVGDGWRITTKIQSFLPYIVSKHTHSIELLTILFGIYPFISAFAPLGICFLILKKAQRLELMAYPLMSFACATMLSIVFSSIGLIEIGGLFWCAMFGIYFRHRTGFAISFCTSLFIVLLGAGHEASVLCLPLLFYPIISCRHANLKKKDGWAVCFALLVSLSTLSCIYRAYYGPYPTSHLFADFFLRPTLRLDTDSYLGIVLCMLGLFILSTLKDLRITFIFLLMALACLIPIHVFRNFSGDPNIAADERHLSEVLISILGLAFAMAECFSLKARSIENRWIPLLIAAAMLGVASLRDIVISNTWIESTSKISEMSKNIDQNCAQIGEKEFHFLFQRGIDSNFLPTLSLLLQKTTQPHTILFVVSDVPVCEIFAKENIIKIIEHNGKTLSFGWKIPANGVFKMSR
jgi:hypothetical protein